MINMEETIYDLSNFKVTDLIGNEIQFTDEVDVVKIIANKLYRVADDIGLMDKIKVLYNTKTISLNEHERVHLIELLKQPNIQLHALIIMAFKDILTK